MKIKISKGIETPVTKFFCSSPETDAFFLKKGVWSDDILAFCRKLERERDELRRMSVAELMLVNLNVHHYVVAWENRCLEAEQERDEARKHCESIVDKAKELIARWDQPSWKDTAPTAGFIYALRNAVEAYEKQKP